MREILLREPELDLGKTLDICRAVEMSQAKIKAVGDFTLANVHLVKGSEEEKPPTTSAKQLWYPFPAWGKKCDRCVKDNHFAKKCSLNTNSKQVSVVEEEDE